MVQFFTMSSADSVVIVVSDLETVAFESDAVDDDTLVRLEVSVIRSFAGVEGAGEYAQLIFGGAVSALRICRVLGLDGQALAVELDVAVIGAGGESNNSAVIGISNGFYELLAGVNESRVELDNAIRVLIGRGIVVLDKSVALDEGKDIGGVICAPVVLIQLERALIASLATGVLDADGIAVFRRVDEAVVFNHDIFARCSADPARLDTDAVGVSEGVVKNVDILSANKGDAGLNIAYLGFQRIQR